MNEIIAHVTSSNIIFMMHDSAVVMSFIIEDSILIETARWITFERASLLICFYINVCTHYISYKSPKRDSQRQERGERMKILSFIQATFVTI